MKRPIILEVKGLKTWFFTEDGVAKAVDGIDFSMSKGETLCLVGESGSGKSVTALSIMRLLQEPEGRIVDGEILFEGSNLVTKNDRQMQDIRGNDISMIFQEPMTSLNPVFTIGDQIMEALQLHQGMKKVDATKRTLELLALVGIPLPERRIHDYPHQMSGGMRQRVMIAMALACDPKLLIADEPTTALDVTIQAQILDLMRDIQKKTDTAVLLITHDLGIVAEMATKVAVMYAGQIVEYASTRALFKDAKHPYTIGLLKSIPNINEDVEYLDTIQGVVPSIYENFAGCRFASRCSRVMDQCKTRRPAISGDVHLVRCFLHSDEEERDEEERNE